MAIYEQWVIFECDCGKKFGVSLEGIDEFNEDVVCPVCECTPNSEYVRGIDILSIQEERERFIK